MGTEQLGPAGGTENVSGAGPDVPSAPTHDGLFVRRSSGLVRELSGRDAFGMAIGGINPTTVISVAIFFYLSLVAGADLTWPFVVAAVMMVPLVFTYAQLVAAIPRSGGDFVYLSRIFTPAVGASMGILFWLWVMYGEGANALAIVQFFLPSLLATLGDLLNASFLTDWGTSLSSGKTEQMLVTGAIIVAVGVIGMRGPRAIGRALFWCFVAGVLAVVVLFVQSLINDSSSFEGAVNESAGSADAYSSVIAAAEEGGWETGSTLSGFLAILPFAAIGFWGFTVGNVAGGEIKRAGRTYIRATLVGLAVGAVLMAGAWTALKGLMGLEYIQAATYLNFNDPDAFNTLTGGTPLTSQAQVGLVADDAFSQLVMSTGFVLGGLLFVLAMVLVSSRLTFALAFDRLLPARLADVSEKTHAPINALVIGAIGAVIFTALTIYVTGFVETVRNTALIWGYIFTWASIAGVALYVRRRELYDAAPKVLPDKSWLGVPLIILIAALSAILQGGLLVFAATNTNISGGYDLSSVLILVGLVVAGPIVYAVSRMYLRRTQSIDIDLAMRELPPE